MYMGVFLMPNSHTHKTEWTKIDNELIFIETRE